MTAKTKARTTLSGLDNAEWAVGAKIHYAMAKPLKDDMKKGHSDPPHDQGH